MVLLLLAHLSMRQASRTAPSGWTTAWCDVVIAGIAVTCAGQAWTMARHGPVALLAVPRWLGARTQAGDHERECEAAAIPPAQPYIGLSQAHSPDNAPGSFGPSSE